MVKMDKNKQDDLSGGAGDADMIRAALLNKDVALANKLLAHPYTLCGIVTHGKALGRRSNMPTANLQLQPDKFIPAHGVYATVTKIDDISYLGVTHIGPRPTVDDSTEVTVETYMPDFSGDIYGRYIETELHFYLRETKKFNNLDEVKAQVDLDIKIARKLLADHILI